MFYDRFRQLCERKGISCNKAALEIGLSNATPTKWKKTGATPVGETLDKIAAYFGVSTDYLLGKEEKAPTNEGERKDILDDVDIAFYGDFKELSEEQKATIRDMVAVMRKRRATEK
ncbi:MAG: helix-turn-helix transcriptional regulator [Clostridia bacterium]|nr:helix-turn-helix transcriptional regulator [Clostridia bacterium]